MKRHLLLWVGVLLIVGCSVVPQQPVSSSTVVSWEARKSDLEQFQQWRVEGRVALRMGRDGGQSSFVWKQSPEQQQFDLAGLLGAGAVRLQSSAEGVVLESDGERYHGSIPSVLLREVTGWHIPVEAAQYWIKGIPDPSQPIDSMVLDESNRLQQLVQHGWRIEVRRYQQVEQRMLPAFVVLEQGEVRVKLKLNQWEWDS